MAKCIQCGRSGISLKLDQLGLCPDCHLASIKTKDARIAELETELDFLRRFRSEYIAITDAKGEAAQILESAQQKAQAILSDATSRAAQIIEEAEAFKRDSENNIATMRARANEQIKQAAMDSELSISMKQTRAEEKLKQTQADTKLAVSYAQQQISALLSLAANNFAFKAKSTAASTYESIQKNRQPTQVEVSDQHSLVSFSSITLSQLKKANGFVVLDLETTGLHRYIDKIIEIGAIKYDKSLREIDRFSTLVNPEKRIPASASAINGIRDSMVKDSPKIAEVLPNLIRFIGDYPIIAHNANFDVGFLEVAIEESGIEGNSIRYADSLKIARKELTLDSYKLSCVAEHFDIPASNLHRALGDCEVLGQIMRHFL